MKFHLYSFKINLRLPPMTWKTVLDHISHNPFIKPVFPHEYRLMIERLIDCDSPLIANNVTLQLNLRQDKRKNAKNQRRSIAKLLFLMNRAFNYSNFSNRTFSGVDVGRDLNFFAGTFHSMFWC